MAGKKIILIFFAALALFAVYFPGFARLQELKEEKRELEAKIADLKKENSALKGEIEKLEKDPTYVERVAREKLKKAKKGEIIYKTEH